MYRALLIAAACLVAAACTTVNNRTATGLSAPRTGTTVLLVKPEVQLGLLTASGLSEPRADWTEQGTQNLETALQAALSDSTYLIRPIRADEAMDGQAGQLLRLHEAVGQSIAQFEYGAFRLPTKTNGFEWTLGEGTSSLAETYGADYALFTYGQGTYASGGRIATMVALSLVGVSVPLGSQQVFTSLVDLRSGKVIWFNLAVAGPQADMRTAEGATSLVTSLLKDAPL